LIAPEDNARRKFATSRGGAEELPVVPMDELKSGVARLVFARGIAFEGIVVDADGFPVPMAEVREAIQWGNLKVLSRTYTDPQGRFQLKDRQRREIILAASANGHGSVSEVVMVEPGMKEVRLQLPRAMPLRGQVLDILGEPIPGASVTLVDHLNEGLGFEFETKTGTDGRFEWTGAPRNELKLAFVAQAVGFTIQKLAASPEEHLIVIPPYDGKIRITGRVTDAESGEAIKEFQAIVRRGHMQGGGTRTDTFHDGVFSLELNALDFKPGEAPVWAVTVTANGYEEGKSAQFYREEGDQDLEIKLERAWMAEGVIWTPEGQPAADASIGWAPQRHAIILSTRNRSLPPDIAEKLPPLILQTRTSSTDQSGRFKLEKALGARGLVAVHESGFAMVDCDRVQQHLDIKLQPWGRIEGVAMLGGQPAAGTQIGLSSAEVDMFWSGNFIAVRFETTTDASGNFVFERVPAGAFIAGIQSEEWGVRNGIERVKALETYVQVASGETRRIVLASAGSSVTARLSFGEKSGRFDPACIVAVLKRETHPPKSPVRANYVRESRWAEAMRRWATDPATIAKRAEARTFVGRVSASGEGTFTDVPPGSYAIEVTIFSGAGFEATKTHELRARVDVPESTAGDRVFAGAFTFDAVR
jgi:hypothetical protein